jgi:hypothetical protein
MRQVLLFSAVFAFLIAPAQARQALKLEIQDGRVTLEANLVPARQILAEWAKVGGTKVVGAEKISGAPLTLKIVNLPERQALDILLRSAAGYMAIPRLASATPGASNYDRILILPTSTAAPSSSPAASASNPAAFRPGVVQGPMGGTERRVPMPRPPGMRTTDADADEPAQAEVEPDPADNGIPNTGQPVFTFPQQPQMPGNQVFVPVPQGGAPGSAPQINLQPNPNGQPTIYNFVPQPGVTAPPTSGFGVIGSPTPGVVQQPVPQPGQPGAVPPKPPGGQN